MPLDQARSTNSSALVGHADGRRGRLCVRLALVFLVGLAVLAASGPAHAQKPRAERPPYSLGEKWIRADGVYDLIRIEKDMYVFAADGGREVHLTKDLTVEKIVERG